MGTAVAGGIVSGVGGAILSNVASDIFSKRDAGSFQGFPAAPQGFPAAPQGFPAAPNFAPTQFSGFGAREEPVEERSLKAVGTAIIGGAASLAAGAIADSVLGNSKRGVSPEYYMDTETGVIYEHSVSERSLKAVGTAIAGGIAAGVAGSVASNVLGRDINGQFQGFQPPADFQGFPAAPFQFGAPPSTFGRREINELD